MINNWIENVFQTPPPLLPLRFLSIQQWRHPLICINSARPLENGRWRHQLICINSPRPLENRVGDAMKWVVQWWRHRAEKVMTSRAPFRIEIACCGGAACVYGHASPADQLVNKRPLRVSTMIGRKHSITIISLLY